MPAALKRSLPTVEAARSLCAGRAARLTPRTVDRGKQPQPAIDSPHGTGWRGQRRERGRLRGGRDRAIARGAGRGRLLGGLVRPLPHPWADPRAGGGGAGRAGRAGQGGHGREPEAGGALRDPRDPGGEGVHHGRRRARVRRRAVGGLSTALAGRAGAVARASGARGRGGARGEERSRGRRGRAAAAARAIPRSAIPRASRWGRSCWTTGARTTRRRRSRPSIHEARRPTPRTPRAGASRSRATPPRSGGATPPPPRSRAIPTTSRRASRWRARTPPRSRGSPRWPSCWSWSGATASSATTARGWRCW